MPRTSLFNFFDRFRAGQIGDAKKQPRFSDDIQMVSMVQDLSIGAGVQSGFSPGYAAPSPVLVEYAFHRFQASVAGQFVRIELVAAAAPAGAGLWVMSWAYPAVIPRGVFVFTLAAPTGLPNFPATQATASAFGDGADATALLNMGTTAAAPPASAWFIRSISEQNEARKRRLTDYGGIYIGPGRVFCIQSDTAGSIAEYTIMWREIAGVVP